MKKLYLFGVNHFSPICGYRLIKKYQYLDDHCGPPEFVAVEWKKSIFHSILSQRKKFDKLIREEFPNRKEDFYDLTKNSLGYEADSHLKIWPDSKTVWLDEKRNIENNPVLLSEIKAYASGRVKILKQNSVGICSLDDERFLKQLDKNLKRSCELDLEREENWKLILKPELKESINYAIIVVGDDHLTKGIIPNFLKNLGFVIELSILTSDWIKN